MLQLLLFLSGRERYLRDSPENTHRLSLQALVSILAKSLYVYTLFMLIFLSTYLERERERDRLRYADRRRDTVIGIQTHIEELSTHHMKSYERVDSVETMDVIGVLSLFSFFLSTVQKTATSAIHLFSPLLKQNGEFTYLYSIFLSIYLYPSLYLCAIFLSFSLSLFVSLARQPPLFLSSSFSSRAFLRVLLLSHLRIATSPSDSEQQQQHSYTSYPPSTRLPNRFSFACDSLREERQPVMMMMMIWFCFLVQAFYKFAKDLGAVVSVDDPSLHRITEGIWPPVFFSYQNTQEEEEDLPPVHD